jgi:hypothetical protein
MAAVTVSERSLSTAVFRERAERRVGAPDVPADRITGGGQIIRLCVSRWACCESRRCTGDRVKGVTSRRRWPVAGYDRPVLLPEYPIETARADPALLHTQRLRRSLCLPTGPEVARYLHWDARDLARARQALEGQCRETSLEAEGGWLAASSALLCARSSAGRGSMRSCSAVSRLPVMPGSGAFRVSRRHLCASDRWPALPAVTGAVSRWRFRWWGRGRSPTAAGPGRCRRRTPARVGGG